MDISKEYIKMCEKAIEIQEGWKPQRGDFYCYQDIICGAPVYTVESNNLRDLNKSDTMKGKYCMICDYAWDSFQNIYSVGWNENDALLGRFVFLPRQDQLLEVAFEDDGLQTVCTELEWFSKDAEYGAGFTISGTMEQLLLAYVMKFNRNKTWNGEDWI